MTGAEAIVVAAVVTSLGAAVAAWIQARRGAVNTGPDGHLSTQLADILRWQGAHAAHHQVLEGTPEAAPASSRAEPSSSAPRTTTIAAGGIA